MALWASGPGFFNHVWGNPKCSQRIREAARVDGAGPLMSFISITLPMISQRYFSLVINLTSAFGGSIRLTVDMLFSHKPIPMDGYIISSCLQRLTWAMLPRWPGSCSL